MAAPIRGMMESARLDADEAGRAFVRRNFGDGDLLYQPENLALLFGPDIINAACGWFNGMHKCVLTSTGHDFVTCDEPVVLLDPVAAQNHDAQALKRTTRSRDCEATYPLTRRYCLLMSYKPIVAAHMCALEL
ncbi:MAG TPA: DUF4238 domain-containing protein [Candidatus Elarobacter sp.]|nr:DUF4238 domain-containing protein [Candidatus Elarobacter sp.]